MLFSPIKIGSMELRNRFIQSPMGVSMSESDGRITEREIAYYAARAKGGFALLTWGGKRSPLRVRLPQLYRDIGR